MIRKKNKRPWGSNASSRAFLLSEKSDSLGTLAAAGIELVCCELNKYGIFTDALDVTPRNAVVVGLSKKGKAFALRKQECRDPSVIAVKLKASGAAESAAVAEVDDLHRREVSGGKCSHGIPPLELCVI